MSSSESSLSADELDESMYSSSNSGCDDPAGMYLNEPEYTEAERKALGVECEETESLQAHLKWSNFFSFGEIFFKFSLK